MAMTEGPIARQVQAMARAVAEKPPSDAARTFMEERRALAARGIPPGVAGLGFRLPDVPMLDPTGAPVRLYDAVADRWAVLVFYRGAWCPYCNLTLKTYQEQLLSELNARGTALVAISPQTPDGSLTMKEKHALTYAVLSDPGNVLAHLLGVLTRPSPEALAVQRQNGLDVTVINADGTPAVPMPTTVILDPDRAVRWIDVHPDYQTRSEPAEILAALDEARR